MAFSETQKAVLRELANYSWDVLPSDCYFLDWSVVDSHETAVPFAQNVTKIKAIFAKAGLEEKKDFSMACASKFPPDDIRRLDIPYPVLNTPELNDFLDDQLLRKHRSNIAKS